jgi:hypothetical protein
MKRLLLTALILTACDGPTRLPNISFNASVLNWSPSIVVNSTRELTIITIDQYNRRVLDVAYEISFSNPQIATCIVKKLDTCTLKGLKAGSTAVTFNLVDPRFTLNSIPPTQSLMVTEK